MIQIGDLNVRKLETEPKVGIFSKGRKKWRIPYFSAPIPVSAGLKMSGLRRRHDSIQSNPDDQFNCFLNALSDSHYESEYESTRTERPNGVYGCTSVTVICGFTAYLSV